MRTLPLLTAAAALLGATSLRAQESTRYQSFDVSRAMIRDSTVYQPFRVTETVALREALADGTLRNETPVAILERSGWHLAFVMAQLLYHHAAQGKRNGEPWLVSFWPVCNTGVGLTPLVDGQELHLEWRGLYDGVSILRDDETGTLWHHITGEGLYGPLAGKRLGTPSNLLHTTVEVALEMYPDIEIAISDRPLVRENRWAPLLGRIPVLGRGLRATMAREDERLPTMEIGIGVWVGDSTARFYAMRDVNAAGDALVDSFEGRQVVVYFDHRSRSLQAAYVDAQRAWWEEDVLLMDNGFAMSGGFFLGADGQRVAVERPLQQFTRWYGWALTFPGTDIWEPDN